MHYYNATICENGHVISEDQSDVQNFCSMCGKPTLSTCRHCKTPILGLPDTDFAILGRATYKKPCYCHECGKPYPWTEQILNNAVELVSLDNELDPTSKEIIRTAIPDLIIDTPITPLAAARYQKTISKASDFAKISMHNLLIDIVTETAKRIIF